MRSENKTNIQEKSKKSFIEEARQVQIIDAAIETIAALGSAQASLAKIAERANVSTSLILYHFKDREELMAATLASIIAEWEAPAIKAVAEHTSPCDKLRGYIEARLGYIGTRPKQSIAMVSLLFSVRPNSDTQAYRTQEDGFGLGEIVSLLEEGQRVGEFKPFDVNHMAIMIRSTIDQFLGYSQVPGIDLEKYVKDLLGWYGVLIAKKGKL